MKKVKCKCGAVKKKNLKRLVHIKPDLYKAEEKLLCPNCDGIFKTKY